MLVFGSVFSGFDEEALGEFVRGQGTVLCHSLQTVQFSIELLER